MKFPIGFIILNIGFVFAMLNMLTNPNEPILFVGLCVMIAGIVITMSTDWAIEYNKPLMKSASHFSAKERIQ